MHLRHLLTPAFAFFLSCTAPRSVEEAPRLELPITREKADSFCSDLSLVEKVRYIYERLSRDRYLIETSNANCPEYLALDIFDEVQAEYALSRVPKEPSCAQQHLQEIAENKRYPVLGMSGVLVTRIHVPVQDGLVIGVSGKVEVNDAPATESDPTSLRQLNVFAAFPSVKEKPGEYSVYIINDENLEAVPCSQSDWERPFCEMLNVEMALSYRCFEVTMNEVRPQGPIPLHRN